MNSHIVIYLLPISTGRNYKFICFRTLFINLYVLLYYEQGDETIYDESYYEYEFKFCPECGAKIINGGDTI